MNYCTNYCDGKQLLQRHPLRNPPLLRTPKAHAESTPVFVNHAFGRLKNRRFEANRSHVITRIVPMFGPQGRCRSRRFCKSAPSSCQKVDTPPICIAMLLPFASRFFCRSVRGRGHWSTSNECLNRKHLSAPKSQRFLRFAIAMPIADPRNRAISETRQSKVALRFKGARKVASDLRFRAAISEPKTPSFCGISGDLAQSTRKSLAIAIVRFWCAKENIEKNNRRFFAKRRVLGNRPPVNSCVCVCVFRAFGGLCRETIRHYTWVIFGELQRPFLQVVDTTRTHARRCHP